MSSDTTSQLVKAYPRQFVLANPDKYRLFLKKNLLKLNPRYYSVAYFRKVETVSGPMYALKIVDAIEDPAMEPIAECWINNMLLYLWMDRCWMIAVDSDDREISNESATQMMQRFDGASSHCHKTMLLHQIGTDPV